MRRHVLTNNPQVFKFHDTAERKHSATESLLKFLESLSDRKKMLSLELSSVTPFAAFSDHQAMMYLCVCRRKICF